jgi:hypothetical protein
VLVALAVGASPLRGKEQPVDVFTLAELPPPASIAGG